MSASVLALVGTDHHPFDRLVDWIDEAAARRPDVHFLMQYGDGRAPVLAEGHRFLAHDRLKTEMGQSAVVVCHGGPGTIMDARAVGHIPICVPRDPHLGEHVDGHQLRFARLVDAAGVVRAVHDATGFQTALDAALLAGPETRAIRTFDENAATLRARAALAQELDLILGAPRRAGRTPWRRRTVLR